MPHTHNFDETALAAAVESATVKALTGDPVTEMYAQGGLTGLAALKDIPGWRGRTVIVENATTGQR